MVLTPSFYFIKTSPTKFSNSVTKLPEFRGIIIAPVHKCSGYFLKKKKAFQPSFIVIFIIYSQH
jgi:hypothetical protein